MQIKLKNLLIYDFLNYVCRYFLFFNQLRGFNNTTVHPIDFFVYGV